MLSVNFMHSISSGFAIKSDKSEMFVQCLNLTSECLRFIPQKMTYMTHIVSEFFNIKGEM